MQDISRARVLPATVQDAMIDVASELSCGSPEELIGRNMFSLCHMRTLGACWDGFLLWGVHTMCLSVMGRTEGTALQPAPHGGRRPPRSVPNCLPLMGG